jgi:hypothetical protein
MSLVGYTKKSRTLANWNLNFKILPPRAFPEEKSVLAHAFRLKWCKAMWLIVINNDDGAAILHKFIIFYYYFDQW